MSHPPATISSLPLCRPPSQRYKTGGIDITKPAVALIGAEFEENLSLRYLAAAVEREGFAAHLVPFNTADRAEWVARRVVELDPLVVGISVPFQMRAAELLGIAALLRQRGSSAHICAGGHFATFEYQNILRDFPAIDSVVRHEGERTLAELCGRLRDGVSIHHVPGVVTRRGKEIVVEERRRLPHLDELPFPDRRGAPHDVLGVPTAPLVGSRGCYADCSFCCIYAYAANAAGARYRWRSPENIAAEMWQEYSERGVRLFIFHDDNFFVPSERKNIERYKHLKRLLDRRGMDDIALVIKCRPNDVHPELFTLLQSMGMIRAYVGIETNSGEGIVSLNRRITPEDNRRALRVFRELDVFHSFNILIFDPEATLAGVSCNLDFMEEYADTPFNFCRAEVYAGTPLKLMLEQQGRLHGDYLAWGYEMRDRRVELLFRIATTAFQSRNFKRDGVANLNMGIRFDNEVMRRFYPECWDPDWHARLVDLSRRVGLSSVALMREAHAFASTVDLFDDGAVKAFTIDLARRVAWADLEFVTEIKGLRREMEQRIRGTAAEYTATDGVGADGTGADDLSDTDGVVTDGTGTERSAADDLSDTDGVVTDGTGTERSATDDLSDTDRVGPVWAAETQRLGTSLGSGLSTEILPPPSGGITTAGRGNPASSGPGSAPVTTAKAAARRRVAKSDRLATESSKRK